MSTFGTNTKNPIQFCAASLLAGMVLCAAVDCDGTERARETSRSVSEPIDPALQPASDRAALPQPRMAAPRGGRPAATPPIFEVQGLGDNGWATGSIGASVTNPIMLGPDELKWGPPPASVQPGASFALLEGDPSAPGELFTIRLRLPDAYRIAPHWHFADEHVTVISGALRLGHGDEFDTNRMDTLVAGGFAVLPARHHHYAMAQGQTEIQIHAVGPWKLIYVNPADDPSKSQTPSPSRSGESEP
jgi:hypothetical protein